jgi:hypothetical protein
MNFEKKKIIPKIMKMFKVKFKNKKQLKINLKKNYIELKNDLQNLN